MGFHTQHQEVEYKGLFVFAGIGGGALGFQQAKAHFKGMVGKFRTLVGIDVDPEACKDFEMITGAPARCMDLFSAEQYEAFHGRKPSEGWREATPEDIRESCKGEYPDVIFTSAPCKGFSGLLPNKSALSEKYQALNRLTIRGLRLCLEAFADNLPAAILFENVPRITTRGEELLRDIKELLSSYGYRFHEGYHDCGEIGGLGQKRKRYLLIARNIKKLTSFIYQPPKLRVKSIGEVIGPLPMPDDSSCGRMHQLPRLQWKTWVRLALIPAGGDWRDLEKISQEKYRLEYVPQSGDAYGVQEWDKPASTVIGSARINGSNAVSVADVRLPERDSRHGNVYQVVKFNEPAPCVVGSRFGSGAPAVADSRLDPENPKFNHAYKVTPWGYPSGAVAGGTGPSSGAPCVADMRLSEKSGYNGSPGLYGVNEWEKPAPAVTGSAKVSSSNYPAAIADPRMKCESRSGFMGINQWDEPAPAVTGSLNVTSSNTPAAVADPRVKFERHSKKLGPLCVGKWEEPITTITGSNGVNEKSGIGAVADPRYFDNSYKVQQWDRPAGCITGGNAPSCGAKCVADPRLGCQPRSGTMKVQSWDKPSDAVVGTGNVHAGGSSAVADPRLPDDNERPNPVPVIVSLDGTWHRPLTTLELAVLQSFPVRLPDGRPLVLAGNSDGKWRERIGNAVPPETARAIAAEMLKALLMNGKQDFILHNEPVWVKPVKEVRA